MNLRTTWSMVVIIGWCVVAPVTVLVPVAAQEAVTEPAATSPANEARRSQPTFGLDRVRAMQSEFGGYPLWQYAASLLWVVLAFVATGLIDWTVTHQLRRLTARTKTDLDEKLVDALHRPVKLVVTPLLLKVGVQMFQWPDWAERLLQGAFTIAIAAAVGWLLWRLVDWLLAALAGRLLGADAQLAKLLLPVLGKSLKLFLLVIVALTAAQSLGLPITSVVAGLGIGGIAVALAAQNTLANVFGTITLLADRPFRVGDRVQIDKYDGAVETIGLRSTRIRTLDGHLVTLPNKIVAEDGINNISLRPTIRQLLTLSLTYDTSPEKMQEAVALLRNIFGKHPLTHDVWVYWKDYGPHSLDIFIVYWCKTTVFKEFMQAMEEINLEIKRRFDAARLDFAFPTRTIHLRLINQSP